MGLVKATFDALAKAAPRLAGTQSWVGSWGSNRPGLTGERDWTRLVGDGSNNSIVEACLAWICRNFPEAPVVVEEIDDNGITQMIRGHPMAQLIAKPNDALGGGGYGSRVMWAGVMTSFTLDGNAYLLKARNASNRVVELYYLPHMQVEPRRNEGSSKLIDFYEYTVGGKVDRFSPSEIIHIRAPNWDPINPLKSRSQLRTLFREIGVDEEGARYAAALLHNMGIPGVILSPAPGTPGMSEDQRDALKGKYQENFGGDRRGSVMVTSNEVKLQTIAFPPKDMDYSGIRNIPEGRISGVLGIPAAIAGLSTGMEQVRVGATLETLLDIAYMGRIIPDQKVVAEALESQLLPDFASASELDRLHVKFDLSRVRVLLDAQNKIAERTSTLARAGIAKRSEARAAVGLTVSADDDVYIPSPGVQELKPDGTPLNAEPLRALPEPEEDEEEEPLALASGKGAKPDTQRNGLTAREAEIASRVATGKTNRQIADELVISERTVDSHVGKILGKMGLHSRAQIRPTTTLEVAEDDGLEAKFAELRELVTTIRKDGGERPSATVHVVAGNEAAEEMRKHLAQLSAEGSERQSAGQAALIQALIDGMGMVARSFSSGLEKEMRQNAARVDALVERIEQVAQRPVNLPPPRKMRVVYDREKNITGVEPVEEVG